MAPFLAQRLHSPACNQLAFVAFRRLRYLVPTCGPPGLVELGRRPEHLCVRQAARFKSHWLRYSKMEVIYSKIATL